MGDLDRGVVPRLAWYIGEQTVKIEKYPCVVWNTGGWRITATVKGPVLETLTGDTWNAAKLDKAGQVLLGAYHVLMQEADCEVPKVKAAAPVAKTVDVPATKGWRGK